MAKRSNNLRSKKLHSSKPYDVSNSLVKKVTSQVSNLLPQSSWLSRWFASTTTAAIDDEPSETLDEENDEEGDDDNIRQSPPNKRARIPLNRSFPAHSFRVSSPIGETGEKQPWPSESVASPIPNTFSDSPVAGPSGVGRSSATVKAFQPSSQQTEGLEGKLNGDGGSDSSESTSGCSSLVPQRTASGTSPTTHCASVETKVVNHMQTPRSLFPSGSHKTTPSLNSSLSRRRPSFNISPFGSPLLDSSKLSRDSSLHSPFYMGRTMYGGASAYRRPRDGLSTESILGSSRRGGVTVRPANEHSQSGTKAEASMSHTARRILEALEQFSSPVSDARRMPLSPAQPPLSGKRKRPQDAPEAKTKMRVLPAAAATVLTIPTPPDRLRLRRLQDTTEAARKIASSVSNSSDHYQLGNIEDTGSWHLEKIRQAASGKVTKYKPLDEEELAPPVNLPRVSLPITTLPSFDLFAPHAANSSSPGIWKSAATVTSTSTTSVTTLPSFTSNSEKFESVKPQKSRLSSEVEKAESVEEKQESNVTSRGPPAPQIMEHKMTLNNTGTSIAKFPKALETNLKTTDSVDLSNVASTSTPISFHGGNKTNTGSSFFAKNPNYESNSPLTNAQKFSTVGGMLSAQTSKVGMNTNTQSPNNLVVGEFTFKSPIILSIDGNKIPTSDRQDFTFSEPEQLDYSKYMSIFKRGEHNGFHKPQSGSKLLDGKASCPVPNAGLKEVACSSAKRKCEVSSSVPAPGKSDDVKLDEKKLQAEPQEQVDTWVCPLCTILNKATILACNNCGSKQQSSEVPADTSKENSNQAPPLAPASGFGKQFQLQPGMWECSECLVRNKECDSKCVACTTPRAGSVPVREAEPPKASADVPVTSEAAKKPSEGWGDKFKKPSDVWVCSVCMVQNRDSNLKCVACEEPKPGTRNDRTSSGGSLKFNFIVPPSSNSFKFGIDKADDNKQASVSSSIATGFKFGDTSTVQTTASTTGFVFGATSGSASPPASKMPTGITFGIPATTASNFSSAATSSSAPVFATASSNSTVVATGKTPVVSSSSASGSVKGQPQPDSTSKVGAISFGAPVDSNVTSTSKKVEESKEDTASNSKGRGKAVLSSAPPKIPDEKDAETTNKSSTPKTEGSTLPATPTTNFTFGSVSKAAVTKPIEFSVTSVSNSPVQPSLAPTFGTPIFSFGGSPTSSPFARSATTTASPSVTTSISSASSTTTTAATMTTTAATITTMAAATTITSVSTSAIATTANTTSATTTSTSSPTFSIGSVPTPATIGGFSFKSCVQSGPLKQQSGEGLFSNKATAVATTGSLFGGSSASAGKPATTLPAAPAFSIPATASSVFGTGTSGSMFATPSTTSSSLFGSNVVKPVFSSSGFGSTTTTTTTTANSFGTAQTAPSFGATTTSSGFGTLSSIPTFGAKVTSTPSFASSTAPSFGIASTTAFATSTTASGFGATNTTPSFGTVTTTPAFGTSNAPSFGASAGTAFGTSGPASFGTPAPATTTTIAPGFGSPQTAVTTTASSLALPVFGGYPAAKANAGLFLFGTTPTTSATSGFAFNPPIQANASNPASKTPVFTFGSGGSVGSSSATAVATTVAATSAPSFGGFTFSTAGAPTLFGNTAGTSSPAPPAFGASTPAPAPSVPTFGAPAPANAANAPAFRPPTFNFSTGNTQQPFSFGAASQSNAPQIPGSSGFSFGQNPNQPQPPTFNPNVRPSFNFTGGETPQFTAAAGPTNTPQPGRRLKKAVRRTNR